MRRNEATNYNLYRALKDVYDDVNLKIIQLVNPLFKYC